MGSRSEQVIEAPAYPGLLTQKQAPFFKLAWLPSAQQLRYAPGPRFFTTPKKTPKRDNFNEGSPLFPCSLSHSRIRHFIDCPFGRVVIPACPLRRVYVKLTQPLFPEPSYKFPLARFSYVHPFLPSSIFPFLSFHSISFSYTMIPSYNRFRSEVIFPSFTFVLENADAILHTPLEKMQPSCVMRYAPYPRPSLQQSRKSDWMMVRLLRVHRRCIRLTKLHSKPSVPATQTPASTGCPSAMYVYPFFAFVPV